MDGCHSNLDELGVGSRYGQRSRCLRSWLADSIGMHFGTFRLTTEGLNEPVAALGRARSAAGIDDAAFTTLDVGESARL